MPMTTECDARGHSTADDVLAFAGLMRLSELLSHGQVTPRELAEFCLARIERIDPTLGAFISVREPHAGWLWPYGMTWWAMDETNDTCPEKEVWTPPDRAPLGYGETKQECWIQKVQNGRAGRGYRTLPAQNGRQAPAQDHRYRPDPPRSQRCATEAKLAARSTPRSPLLCSEEPRSTPSFTAGRANLRRLTPNGVPLVLATMSVVACIAHAD